MTRNKYVFYAVVAGIFFIAFVSHYHALWAIPLMGLSIAVVTFPTRRRLLQERWRIGTYLITMGRFWLALTGFWVVLTITPGIVLLAGAARLPVAAFLAVLLLAWSVRYTGVFVKLVGARRQPLGPRFSEIIQRTGIHPPRLFTLDFKGGRVVNAVAFPSRRSSAVAFTDSVLELFTPDEQVAVFAHEVAHLEWHTPSRLLRAELLMTVLIGVATIGTAFVPMAGTIWVVVTWPYVLLVVSTLRRSRRRQQEHWADQRAVSLCGDREAVVRALDKLYTLGLWPRRWGSDVERGATHPSLARRIQAMGTTTETSRPETGWSAVFTARDPRICLLFESDRLTMFTGVPSGTSPDAETIRERASGSRTFLYSDLVELRVRAGILGPPSLVWVTHAGESWAASVHQTDVARLQTTLDAIDTKLAILPARFPFRAWVGRGILLILAILGGKVGPHVVVFVVGLVGVLVPSPTALSSAAAVAAGAAAFALRDASELNWVELSFVMGLFAVAAVSLWFARKRESFQTRWEVFLPIGMTTGATLLVYAAFFWWGVPVLSLSALRLPDALQLLFGVACGLLTVWKRTRRWSPVVALAAAVFLYAFGVGWLGPLRLDR